jgi:soluble lytic murein transglycosylase-like protein
VLHVNEHLTFALRLFNRCATSWPTSCSSAAVLYRLVQPTILLLLTASVTAQSHRKVGPSLQRRLQLEPLISRSAKRYGIDPRILSIVCFVESRYRIDAISLKGARGPMQFMPDTARRYGLQDPHDPSAAIDAAAHYLRDLLFRFNGRLDLALAAYNAGEGTVESFLTGKPLRLTSGKLINPRGLVTGGIPPYPETKQYVNSIIGLFMQRSQVQKTAFMPVSTDTKPGSFKTRDFTFDVFSHTEAPQPRLNSRANGFFIEVQ